MKNYDLIYELANVVQGLWLDKIEGYPTVGDMDSFLHPIQYRALTNTRVGDDDPFEGIGWTPSEAMRNLRKTLLDLSHTQEEEKE